MYVRTISLSRTSYSIFISGGLYCRIYAFYVHYPEEGNNNTLTLTFNKPVVGLGALRICDVKFDLYLYFLHSLTMLSASTSSTAAEKAGSISLTTYRLIF